ncbi:retrovirus-related pol polyprotein from transposon TNT 1-94 [Tanacetum coccineum]
MENYKNVSQDIRDQLNTEAEAVQIILTWLDNDIYSIVDVRPNTCEVWKAIERLKQVNVQFLLQLQPEWQRFVTLVKQSQELKTVSYHKLYDILKQHQNEVNEIRAERLARTANPLALSTRNKGKSIVTSSAPTYDPEPAMVTEDEEMSKEKEIDKLMALISLSFKKIYKPTNNNLRTSSNTSRANQDNSPRINRGTGYDNQRAVNVAGARENVGTPVVQKSGIQCYNCKEYGHVSRECQKPKRVKDAAYHKEKMLLCKQEEAGVQLNAEQADWKDDTDDESDDQELEAHYMYMAQLQEVTPDPVDNSGPIFDDEPMHKVQNNNDNYNVFAMENEHPEQPESSNDIYLTEQGDSNITIDSSDICYDRAQDDQDETDDLDQERDLLASLIQKLKCEIDDSKNRNKFLESSNKELVDKLKGEIEDFKTKNKSLESSNNHFKEANNELSKTNQLMFKDLKKFQAELDKYNDVNYASKVEIDCAKAKGDLMSYKIDFEKSSNAYTQQINDLNQTILDMKKELYKELDKVIALENKVKVLNDIVYKTGQSVQTMNMLNRNCKTSFAKPEFLKKAQRANPRLYDIGCYNDNLALMLAPDSDENDSNTLKSNWKHKKTQFLNEIDRLSREYYYADHMNAILGIYTDLDEFTDLQCDYGETLEKCERLEKELSKSRTMSKSFESLQKHAINLELDLQQCKEKIKNDKSFKENQSNVFLKEREQYFEIQDLKAQLQDKGIAISELKKLIEKMKGKSVETKFEKSSVIRQPNAFKSQRQSILGKPAIFSDSLAKKDFSKSKPVTTQNVSNDFSKPVTAQILPQNKLPIVRNTNVIAPGMYKVHTKPNHTRTPQLHQDIRKPNKRVSFSTGVIPNTSVSRPQLKSNHLEDRVMSNNSPGRSKKTRQQCSAVSTTEPKHNVEQICFQHPKEAGVQLNAEQADWKDDTDDESEEQELEAHYMYMAQIHEVTPDSVDNSGPIFDDEPMHKLVEIVLFIVDSGCSKHMTRNLKLLTNFVEKFMGTVKFGNDQIAPILGFGDLVQGTITIKQGNDFLIGSRGTDLYSITLQDSSTPNPICLMAKATSSQAWLWHRRLSHLHFDTINLLSKNNIVNGLLKLKFVKDHLGLHAQVTTVRTDKGTKFLNKTLHAYFAKEGIRHETSTARTPEQNGVVERRNRTLVEAARTMLSAAKVPLFFWAEAIATACFTQNRSLVIPRHEKTPYHIINARKPSVKFFHIFGSLCYIVKDGENLDKMKEKGDACIFVGYSTQSKAYRVFNKRTRIIVETIHVNFDELPQMASDHVSSDPGPQCSTTVLEQDSLSPGPQSQENVPQVAETVTTSNELELLYSPMFSELLNGTSPVVSKSSAVHAADNPDKRQQHNTTHTSTTTDVADPPPLNIQNFQIKTHLTQ